MSQFELIEVKSSEGKNYYIRGYVSTVDPDFVNDIVDEDGQESTFREIIGSDITMDEDHEEWRDPETGKLYDSKKNKYPLAKVVDAKLDKKGTWVKAKLNKYHPDFETKILPMIKEKYLHSFSIAYKVKKAFDKIVNGIKYRVIQDLNISNIAITGNPVNTNATFNMALKSYHSKMAEENNTENQTEISELKSQVESLQSELSELKTTDYKKMYENMKAKYDKMKADYDKMVSKQTQDKEEVEGKSENEMKSNSQTQESQETTQSQESNKEDEIAKLRQEVSELKSYLEQPQMKSTVSGKSVEPQQNNTQENKKITMWDKI